MHRFVIGVDFGTQSARAVLVDCRTGKTVAEKSQTYPHGVIDYALPDGTPLTGDGWALAHPQDYLDALKITVRGVTAAFGAAPDEIGALAIAATACTLLPVNGGLIPLCQLPGLQDHPHAYCKLWKHHRAQPYADRMTETARAMHLPFLADYGGRISSEWAIPKVMEVYHEDRAVYDAADRFMQFSDWLTAWMVDDPDVQNGSIASYKALWSFRDGDPSDTYLAAVGEEAVQIVHEKLRGRKLLAGECAGRLCASAAVALGLQPGTRVGMAHTDAHSAAYGAGIAGEGDYVFILGTSSCGHLLSSRKERVPGVTGALTDSLIRGYTCYSAGQACVGDMLDWLVRSALPPEYQAQAAARGKTVYQLLEEEASTQQPGECGMIVLDWFNGNRSILANANLSGLLLGMTIKTGAADIYRAMLDAIAFGHREIVEQFYRHGLQINRMVICGGIAHKNDLLLQIMADVLNRRLEISADPQATALGAAICAATALGAENGGYDSLPEAVGAMHAGISKVVSPDPLCAARYEPLYGIYQRLYQFFGQEAPDIMKQLYQLQSK